MFYFMLLMVLTLPILMIIFGFIFKKNPPKSINWFYGYRTFRSMKDQKSWDYANKKMGEYWFKIGWIILPLSVIPLLFVKNSNIDIISYMGTAIVLLQLIPLFISIYLIERDLRVK